MLGKEVKMGPVQLLPEVHEAVRILKDKIQSMPVLVFLDFDKPFLLETDASKKGLDMVLSQKQGNGCYQPIMFGSHSLTPSEKNYHSSKLKFLTLKWSVTEHFKECLTYTPFVVSTDNNPLTCVLTTPNLNATGHRWVGTLASFEFTLKYQKGADNGAADALSHIPICHNHEMVWSLLEGAIMGAVDRGEAEANEELLGEHEHLGNKAHVQAARMAPMHILDWGEAREVDLVLATCRRWLHSHRDTPFPKRDVLLRKYLGDHVNMEEGHVLFHMHNGLIMSKGLLYIRRDFGLFGLD